MEISLEEFKEIRIKEAELSNKLDTDEIDENEYANEINRLKDRINKATNLKRFSSKKKFLEFIKGNMKSYEEELKTIEHEAFHAEAKKRYGLDFYFYVLTEEKDNKAHPFIKTEPDHIKIKRMDQIKRTIFNIEVLTAPYNMSARDINDLKILLNRVRRYKKFTPQQKELLIDMAVKLANKKRPG